MKSYILPLLGLLFVSTQTIYAQCGTIEETTFVTTQSDLDDLSDCEVFQGNLSITGSEIFTLEGLSSLLIIQGNLSIYDTSIESIEELDNLMNAYEINIYNNDFLSACCASLDWQSGLDFGTILAVNILSNAEGCNSYAEAQATCLGLIPGCTDANAVNYNSGATFDDESCLNGPDLQVSVNTILNSLHINSFTSSDECLIAEGCITGLGERKTLRFTTSISNYGNEDFYIGQSGGADGLNDNFYWDDCHGHAHYEGYASYRIYTYPSLGPSETIGHKNGWCVMDLGGAISSEAPEGANYPACSFTYGCNIMGISAGCSDTYSSGIACQWVDVTDLEDGEYVLAVSSNMETDNYIPLYEIDFSNNVAYVLFEIETNDDGETVVLSASEFDGSSISDICSPNPELTALGFNFSESTAVVDEELQMPTAYLNEYYTEAIQFVLTETMNLNGTIVYVDSLEINSVSGLPIGLDWSCEPASCSFPVGNSCTGITGIPELTGNFEASISSTLYFTDTEGFSQIIELPYLGGNPWLDAILDGDNSVFDAFTPSMSMSVELPVYGCMDSVSINFDPLATFDDGSCESYVYGCTDPFSLTYDEQANTEDGSCEYCAEGVEWVAQIDLMDSYGDGWNGNYYYIINEWGDTTATGTLEVGYAETQLFCLYPGCYIVSVPAEGGWPYEVSWEISSAGYPDVFLAGECPDLLPLSFLEDCETILGCMDTLALNYNPDAEYEDDSCTYPVYGCTDTLALNYTELATDDDGSCLYPIECDETSSLYVLYLHDSYGDGWNGNDFSVNDISLGGYYETTMETGSESISSFCLNDACYLITVDGGTWQAEITWELLNSEGDTVLNGDAPYQDYYGVNSTCVTVFGCTNPDALNYNVLAGTDDGSCILPVVCDEGYNMVLMELQTDPYPYETSWDLITANGDTLIAMNGFVEQNTLYEDSLCVPDDMSITFNLYDTYGDGLTSGAGDGEFHFYVCGAQVFSGSYFEYLYSGTFTDCEGADIIVFGCTDETAINYSPDANTDDGSCEYEVVLGCMDAEAINYNEAATDNNGSCEYMTCEFYEMLVEVNLISTNGNGWESLYYELGSFDASLIETGTLEDGFEQTDYYCLPNGCYLFTVPEYSGSESFNWSVLIEGKKQISGTSGMKENFGVNEICELIMGCTDVNALNYNPIANVNNGTCTYENGGVQILELSEGWNMTSSYVQTENMDVAVITAPIVEDLIIMKNNVGLAYLPDWGFNGIGDWNNTQGYQFKVATDLTIEMNGNMLLPENSPINLAEGWNMISYLRSVDASAEAIFAEFTEEVVIVKNGLGMAYLPDWDFNGIGDMIPGQGYQVKMSSNQELLYNANDIEYRTNTTFANNNSVTLLDFNKNTGSNMHMIIPTNSWDIEVVSDDEVYAYDAQGALIGAAKITFPNTVITLWGDDKSTLEKDGLFDSEEWTLVVNSTRLNKMRQLDYHLVENNDGYEQDHLVVASEITLSTNVTDIALFNSIPNPANHLTEIGLYLEKEQAINLSLYNLLGEEIRVLKNGKLTRGYHSIQMNVDLMAPGTYFYKLETDSKSITKRLEVIK